MKNYFNETDIDIPNKIYVVTVSVANSKDEFWDDGNGARKDEIFFFDSYDEALKYFNSSVKSNNSSYTKSNRFYNLMEFGGEMPFGLEIIGNINGWNSVNDFPDLLTAEWFENNSSEINVYLNDNTNLLDTDNYVKLNFVDNCINDIFTEMRNTLITAEDLHLFYYDGFDIEWFFDDHVNDIYRTWLDEKDFRKNYNELKLEILRGNKHNIKEKDCYKNIYAYITSNLLIELGINDVNYIQLCHNIDLEFKKSIAKYKNR